VPARVTGAGTFIYHTHWGHDTQLTSGRYGPMIVVEPGSGFDPEVEKILVVGVRPRVRAPGRR
jgi:manganese oxidase